MMKIRASSNIGKTTNRLVIRAALFFTAVIILFVFLFGWMNANADSYFYWMIGEYFRSGVYPFTAPFIYTLPTTISPPLYGMWFVLSHGIYRSDILLHALQLILLTFSGVLLYKMLKRHISTTAAILISCGYILFPLNLIYASYVLTESPSQFLLTVWVFLVTRGLSAKKPFYLSIAVCVGAIAGLMKYNMLIYAVLAGIYLLISYKRLKYHDALFPLLAGLILNLWMLKNHQITGVWSLYDTRGTQLYSQFVAQTTLLPPENHPSVIRMRSLLPENTDIAVPIYEFQEQLGASLGGVWRDIDTVLYDVSRAAVMHHPITYITHSIKNTARMHYANLPHWRNLGNLGRTDVSGTDKPYCSKLGTIQMCAPIIMTPQSYTVWNRLIQLEMELFRLFAPLFFYAILLPSIIITALWGKSLMKQYVVMYLVGVIPIGMMIHVDPRYIVPLYPLVTLIIVSGFLTARKYVRRFFLSKSSSQSR